MARLGYIKIRIPGGVSLSFFDSSLKISKDELTRCLTIFDGLVLNYANRMLSIACLVVTKANSEKQGLFHSTIANVLEGLGKPFQEVLRLEGVGYKFKILEGILTLQVGFSHVVSYPVPPLVLAEVLSLTSLKLTSLDKEALRTFASKIRSSKPPEPYKCKGIFYTDEKIVKKIGKKAK
jgi:large subunit ribosomal protein L6